jgi:mono/diheme cytochrome c family protein
MLKLPAITTAIAIATTVATSGDAHADAAKGAMLASQICARCHAVRPGLTSSPQPDAPPFATIAAKPEINIFTLMSYLRTPHWTSANLSLRADDIEAVSSYIMSLQPKK